MIDVLSRGAVGDGVTDDSAAIQAALDAAGLVGGTVHFPVGTYRITKPLVPTGTVRLVGEGRGTKIVSKAATLFHWGVRSSSISHMYLRSEIGGGHIFQQTGPVTNNLFFDLELKQDNDDKSFYRHAGNAGNYLFNQWLQFETTHTYTATVPGFYFLVASEAGATNFNVWRNFEMLRTNNYGFWFESKRSLNYLYDNIIADGAWEAPKGGCVMVLGGNNCVVQNQSVYDLNVYKAEKHLFCLGNGTHSTSPAPSRHCVFRDIRHIGNTSQYMPDIMLIALEDGKCAETVIERVRGSVTGPVLIDYGNNRVLEIGCSSVTRRNAGKVAQVNADGMTLRSPAGKEWRVMVSDAGVLSAKEIV